MQIYEKDSYSKNRAIYEGERCQKTCQMTEDGKKKEDI